MVGVLSRSFPISCARFKVNYSELQVHTFVNLLRKLGNEWKKLSAGMLVNIKASLSNP